MPASKRTMTNRWLIVAAGMAIFMGYNSVDAYQEGEIGFMIFFAIAGIAFSALVFAELVARKWSRTGYPAWAIKYFSGRYGHK